MNFTTLVAGALTLALSSINATSSYANTIYSYTGGLYDAFDQLFATPPSGNPWTTAERITGTVEFAGPLSNFKDLPNITAITPVAFSFTDGINTFTNSNSTSQFFYFATDSNAVPTEWAVAIFMGTNEIALLSSPPGGFPANAYLCLPACDAANFTSLHIASSDALGTWAVHETPLPGALPLFASGLGALGLLGWRRKRKKTAAA